MDVSRLRHYISTPLYRDPLFLIANAVFTTGLGFFFWMVVARFYTPYEVGVASAIISAVYFLVLLGTLGLDVAIIRFLPRALILSQLGHNALSRAKLKWQLPN